MKYFIQMYKDIQKYSDYILYSAKSTLRLQFSGKYFGALWWLLDPILLMITYIFMVQVIFQRGGNDYPVFIFTALISWKWVSATFMTSANAIRNQAYILNTVYIPKHILPLIWNIVEFIHFQFGLITLFILMLITHVKFTWHIFESIPIMIVNFIFILGVSFLFAHIGVYFQDFKNILSFLLRLWFYISPGIYAANDIPAPFIKKVIWFNPMTTFFESYRNVFIYGTSPLYKHLGVWTIASVIILYWGLSTLYKSDKNYIKVA